MLTNNEVVDIVASAESQSCAARAVVESAVRAWRYKYPTSKVDDCAVVCLFLNPHQNNISTASATASIDPVLKPGDDDDLADDDVDDADAETGEAGDGIDWSALEGVSRVNTLLTLPRFAPEELEKQMLEQKKTK